MASLSLRDSVWAEMRKSATKSFEPMGTPAIHDQARPVPDMYATVPSVVTLSSAGGIHWTALSVGWCEGVEHRPA
jgi:hypothetical protein